MTKETARGRQSPRDVDAATIVCICRLGFGSFLVFCAIFLLMKLKSKYENAIVRDSGDKKKGPLRVKLPPTNKNNEIGQIRFSFFSISFTCLSLTNNHIVLHYVDMKR